MTRIYTKAGDDLYFVPTAKYGEPLYIRIAKAGLKYAYTAKGTQIVLATSEVMIDGVFMGMAYNTADEYEELKECGEAWRELQKQFERDTPPDRMTIAKIQLIRELLKP